MEVTNGLEKPYHEQKLSRYRSTRRSPDPALNSQPSSPPPEHQTSAVTRTRSRYHRQQQAQQTSSPPPVAAHDDPALRYHTAQRLAQSPHVAQHNFHDREDSSPSHGDRTSSPRADAERRHSLDSNSANRRGRGGRRAGSSQDELQKLDSQNRHDSPMVRGSGSNPLQPRIVDKPRSGDIRATRVGDGGDDSADDEPKGCLGLFRKKNNDQRAMQSRNESTDPAMTQHGRNVFIKQGGGGIVPGTDAPKSAANAGQRASSQIFFPDLSLTECSGY